MNPHDASSIVTIPINPRTPIIDSTTRMPVFAERPVNIPAANMTKKIAAGAPRKSPKCVSNNCNPPVIRLGPY